MSSTILRRKLLALLSDHSRLLRGLLHQPRILRGSFHQVSTRCGKPNCWCAKARKGHPHARLTWSEEGTNVTRKVPAGESKRVIKLTENYRQFREQRGQLAALELKIQDRLDQYEKALIEEVRKPLSFLAISPRLSARNKSALQTRQPRRKQPM
jgi:hypothetical protein